MTDTLPRVHWSVTRHRYETRCPHCGSAVWDFRKDLVPKRLVDHQRHECPEQS